MSVAFYGNGLGGFESTRWSLVLRATSFGNAQSTEALGTLCRTYWYPLYCYIRRSGQREEDAKDLAQAFFAHLLSTEALGTVHPAKGRFRSFLLASLTNFLHNQWDKAVALKRGGNQVPISWEGLDPEERYRAEPVDSETPDKIFARQWAWTLVQQASARLRDEYHRSGRAEVYDRLQRFITGELTAPLCAQVASELGINEGALKVAMHRLRRRFGEFLRTEIAETLENPAEIDDELRHLFAAVGKLS